MPDPATDTPITFYQDPAVYDILHAKGTAAEVDGLESIVMRYVRTRSRRQTWLEPACGTGRYLRVALSRGTRVIGVDTSRTMLDYAAKRLAKIDPAGKDWTLIQGDMEHLGQKSSARGNPAIAPASVDFAFNPINSIRHLDSDSAMLDHFESIARALKPGGVYAVGLSLAAYGLEQETEDVWLGKRGACTVRQTAQYIPPSVEHSSNPAPSQRFETVISHLEITRPSGTEHQDSTYRLRTYSRDEWMRLLDRSAMQLVETVDEDGDPISLAAPGYGIWILKPRS